MNLMVLFISSVLVGNTVLTEFLGVNSILGINKEKSAVRMGIIIAVMAFLSSTILYLIYHFVLEPFNLIYLKTIVLVLIMMAFVPLMEGLAKKHFHSLDKSFGCYLSTLIVNCTVMGIALLNIEKGYNFFETIVFAIGSSIGFIMILYVFSTLSERMNATPIIRSLKGFPITLIIIGIMAMVFSRYIGIS